MEKSNEMIQNIKYKLDAVWLAAIDPLYTCVLEDDLDNEPYEGRVFGSLWATLVAIYELSLAFNEKSYLHEPLVGIALLTKHIIPKKILFWEWFEGVWRKLSETYPCSYKLPADYNELKYDDSNEPAVFRDFFFGSEPYNGETAKQNTRVMMQSAKNSNNPYLRPSEEMIKLGFKGTPYTI